MLSTIEILNRNINSSRYLCLAPYSILFGFVLSFTSCADIDNDSVLKTAFDDLGISFLNGNKISGHARSTVQIEQFNEQTGERMQSCTGIFISRNHLLTASHCADGKISINPWNTVPDNGSGSFSLYQNQGSIFGQYEGPIDYRFEKISNKKIYFQHPLYKIDHAGIAVFYIPNEALNTIYDGMMSERFDWINLSRLKPFGNSNLVLWHYPWGMPLAESPCPIVELSPPNLYAHSCDAVAGSSGGLLTDASLRAPVAMHLSGPGLNLYSFYKTYNRHESAEDFAVRRGCRKNDDSSPLDPICLRERGFNKAVPLTYVKDTMAMENRWLWDQIAEAARKESVEP
jgi:hypothetical protein